MMFPQRMSPSMALKLGVVSAILIAAGALSLQRAVTQQDEVHATMATVKLNYRVQVQAEVAATDADRMRGLSGHAPLGEDEGMLFIFPYAAQHGFWMKDMLFPIDIIWFHDGLIVDITENVPVPVPGVALPTYAPQAPVNRVLEVQAGFAARHGLRAGMPVEVRLTGKER